MKIAPSDGFIRRTRNPALSSPSRFEPVKKEPGSFVLTHKGLEKVE